MGEKQQTQTKRGELPNKSKERNCPRMSTSTVKCLDRVPRNLQSFCHGVLKDRAQQSPKHSGLNIEFLSDCSLSKMFEWTSS